jgi:hypothetical protein
MTDDRLKTERAGRLAVGSGWVILQDVRGKPLDRKAALTDEGRRLARKGR